MIADRWGTWRCHWCGRLTLNDMRSALRPTIDHVMPQSSKVYVPGLRVIACHRCNNAKGSLSLEKWES